VCFSKCAMLRNTGKAQTKTCTPTLLPTSSKGPPTMIRIRDILFAIAFGLAIGALIAAGI
jgi:hypothetical protein